MPPRAAAYSVKVIAGKGSTPIRESPDETSICDLLLDLVLRDVAKTKPSFDGSNNHLGRIQRKLAINPNFYFAASLFQLPRIKIASGRETQIYAEMFIQILRFERNWPPLEIGGQVTVASFRSPASANGPTASPRSQTGSRGTKRDPCFSLFGIPTCGSPLPRSSIY
jgi:hypothetical protein